MLLDRRQLVDQLLAHFDHSLASARRAAVDAQKHSRHGATAAEKKEDARIALEFGNLAKGQARRMKELQVERQTLLTFIAKLPLQFSSQAAIDVGAIVDVALEFADHSEERTIILLPVGAGTELTGPDGDGFLSVVTPQSPLGKHLMGKHVGDEFDLEIKQQWREYTITGVS